jgi:hypothetical protein
MIGAALGGLTSKKPLQGALMGGALGAAGGQFMPGLLGSGAAAGSGVAGFVPGADIMSGYGALTQAAAPVAEAAAVPLTAAQVAAQSGGALDSATSALKTAQPFMSAANTGLSVANQLAPKPFQAPPVAALQPHQADFSGLLNSAAQDQQLTYDQQMKRRQLMQQYGRA